MTMNSEKKKELLETIFDKDYKRYIQKYPDLIIKKPIAERFFWQGVKSRTFCEEVENYD